ncbi:hypothetical protein O181_006000 [Austropuccinia psidii MF-1]|uniref:Uncharacterized protein n=1 Tax=Austropuccinia psidii MF-1 TaxID=1389203 RepID=A0A9Q3GGE4_9BASI|nr:hypothetical protein [Austropuccinia psidii MF-1]
MFSLKPIQRPEHHNLTVATEVKVHTFLVKFCSQWKLNLLTGALCLHDLPTGYRRLAPPLLVVKINPEKKPRESRTDAKMNDLESLVSVSELDDGNFLFRRDLIFAYVRSKNLRDTVLSTKKEEGDTKSSNFPGKKDKQSDEVGKNAERLRSSSSLKDERNNQVETHQKGSQKPEATWKQLTNKYQEFLSKYKFRMGKGSRRKYERL